MARGRLTFRQRDIVAAINAVKKAGCEVGRVEIGQDGKIAIIVIDQDSITEAAVAEANEWDTA